MKSKMPCEPGPTPLMKFAQATGLCGGTLVPRSLEAAGRGDLREIRHQPGFHQADESRGSMPSMPMTITFLPRLFETRLMLPIQYSPPANPATPAAAAEVLRNDSPLHRRRVLCRGVIHRQRSAPSCSPRR